MSQIVLCMIVKNEALVIERCLASVKPWIDRWVICDTGSTDGTQELVLSAMKDVHGALYEHEWVDFSVNRNRALEAARKMANGPEDYILVMDADDILSGAFPEEIVGEGYQIEYRLGDVTFTRPFLVRADISWQYYGKVHELLMRRPDDALDIPVLTDCHVDCNVGGPYQGREYFLEHARLLEGETDPRSVFYLAQSYECAGESEKAINIYARRTQMEGYIEERVVSWLRLGRLTEDPGCFLESAALNATRQEPWWEIYQWSKGRLPELAEFALVQASVRSDPKGMFVDRSTDWRITKEVAIKARQYARAMAELCLTTPGAETDEKIIECAAF